MRACHPKNANLHQKAKGSCAYGGSFLLQDLVDRISHHMSMTGRNDVPVALVRPEHVCSNNEPSFVPDLEHLLNIGDGIRRLLHGYRFHRICLVPFAVEPR